ncbi:hypothetical protein PMAYCL1PPCAC_19395, partial [Pristionchus mayeri]
KKKKEEEEKAEKKRKKKKKKEKEEKEKEDKEERKKRKKMEKEEKAKSKNLSASNEALNHQKKKNVVSIDQNELRREKEVADKKTQEEISRMPESELKQLTSCLSEWEVFNREKEEQRKKNERAELEKQ